MSVSSPPNRPLPPVDNGPRPAVDVAPASSDRYAPEVSGDYLVEDERGYGWVVFAGTLLVIVGVMNCIGGIAAIANSSFFVHNVHYIIGSLHTWGWIMLCVGVVQSLVGLAVFAKNQFARWSGVVLLGLASIGSLLFMPAYPLWALSLFTLDILALYGLIAYGDRITEG